MCDQDAAERWQQKPCKIFAASSIDYDGTCCGFRRQDLTMHLVQAT
jgi:hypothetical protein